MEEEREGGLALTHSDYSLDTAECFKDKGTALAIVPLQTTAAKVLLRYKALRPSLPVLSVGQGHAPCDVAHLEGDALPVSMEGERL